MLNFTGFFNGRFFLNGRPTDDLVRSLIKQGKVKAGSDKPPTAAEINASIQDPQQRRRVKHRIYMDHYRQRVRESVAA